MQYPKAVHSCARLQVMYHGSSRILETRTLTIAFPRMKYPSINGGSRRFSHRAHAFTLVELIVVITILAILGTIGFLSIQGYSSKSRDADRTSDLSNLAKGLDVLAAGGGTYPQPDANTVTLTASGTPIGYQGYAGSNVMRTIKFGGKGQDPLDGKFYTYSTNIAGNKYQLLGLLENSDSPAVSLNGELFGVETAHAGAYDMRIPLSKGSSMGILVGTGANANQPIQEQVTGNLDILTTTTSYTAVFSNKTTLTGTGMRLAGLKASFSQKNELPVADSSLVGYWDMETLMSDGKLADLSGNGRTGTNMGGIVIGGSGGTGKSGNATYFDGANDYVDLGTFDPATTDMTLSFWLQKDGYTGGTEEIIGKRDGWASDFSDHRWAFYIRGANKVLAYGRYGVEVVTNNPTKLGTWTHYAFTYSSGSTARWYENGTLIGNNTAFSFSNKTNANITIGRAGSVSGEYLSGRLDEIRLYNRSLPESEVQTLYNGTK